MTAQNTIKIKLNPEMIRAMFDCGKDRVSRLDIMGSIGDTFNLKHPETKERQSWEITEIKKHPLKEVAMHMYKKEGFVSEEEFMKFWNRAYPKCNDPNLTVFVHMLKGVGSE